MHSGPPPILITRTDARYPKKLGDVSRPPAQIWVSGRPPAAHERGVAIVGSRGATAAGYEQAQAIGAAIGKAGWFVVSGGALGIDAAAHLGALQVGAPTFAVLGCGVDVVYPDRHVELFNRISHAGGLISEYPPGTQPRGGQFPVRNRLGAALAEAVVVIDARTRSGALITAQRAVDLKRLLLAVPGSRGTDWLIGSGAALPVDSAKQILDRLAGRPSQPSEVPAAFSVLIDALGQGPDSPAGIAQRIGQPLSDVLSALSEAELAGWIHRLPGGRYEVPRAQ